MPIRIQHDVPAGVYGQSAYSVGVGRRADMERQRQDQLDVQRRQREAQQQQVELQQEQLGLQQQRQAEQAREFDESLEAQSSQQALARDANKKRMESEQAARAEQTEYMQGQLKERQEQEIAARVEATQARNLSELTNAFNKWTAPPQGGLTYTKQQQTERGMIFARGRQLLRNKDVGLQGQKTGMNDLFEELQLVGNPTYDAGDGVRRAVGDTWTGEDGSHLTLTAAGEVKVLTPYQHTKAAIETKERVRAKEASDRLAKKTAAETARKTEKKVAEEAREAKDKQRQEAKDEAFVIAQAQKAEAAIRKQKQLGDTETVSFADSLRHIRPMLIALEKWTPRLQRIIDATPPASAPAKTDWTISPSDPRTGPGESVSPPAKQKASSDTLTKLTGQDKPAETSQPWSRPPEPPAEAYNQLAAAAAAAKATRIEAEEKARLQESLRKVKATQEREAKARKQKAAAERRKKAAAAEQKRQAQKKRDDERQAEETKRKATLARKNAQLDRDEAAEKARKKTEAAENVRREGILKAEAKKLEAIINKRTNTSATDDLRGNILRQAGASVVGGFNALPYPKRLDVMERYAADLRAYLKDLGGE